MTLKARDKKRKEKKKTIEANCCLFICKIGLEKERKEEKSVHLMIVVVMVA